MTIYITHPLPLLKVVISTIIVFAKERVFDFNWTCIAFSHNHKCMPLDGVSCILRV